MKRKLQILAVLFVSLIGATIVGYFLWARGAGGGLDKQVAAYKAAGEPIEPADFIAAHIEDDDNAAVALREAARIDEKSKEWKAADDALGINEIGLPLRDKEVAAFRAVIAVNPNAFGGVDDAMTRKGVDWQIPMKSPVISVLLPDLNEQRRLSWLINLSAFLNFHEGKHDAAIKDINRVLFISRTVDLQPVLVSHLVALAQMGMVSDAVQRMAPDLKIGTSAGDASPEQVKLLIAALLNDELPGNGRRRGLRGERMIELDIARCIASGQLDFTSIGTGGRANPAAATVGIALKPLALDDGLIMIRQTSKLIAAADASPDWPTFLAHGPLDLPPEIMQAKFRHALINMVMPAFGRAIETDFRSTANRRLAALALAIRWYAVDHGGKLPEKLNDLVPHYLPAGVPLDALAAGQPLRYIPDPVKPILYSVGANGVDDGGSERVLKKDPRNSNTARDKWAQADYVIPLVRQPRPPEEQPNDGGGGRSTQPAATQPATAPAPVPAE
jgi:hypothetical protein